MGRSHAVCWGTVIALCLCAGCRTTSGWSPLVRTGSPGTDNKAAGDNPFQSPGDKGDTRSESAADQVAVADGENGKSVDGPSGGESGQDESQLASHDAETLKLIERELRDAPPREREQLYNDLKGLDPGLVRLILRNRRMVRNMGQGASGGPREGERVASESSTAARRAGETGTGSQRFPGIGHSGDAIPTLDGTAHAGLGTASPWANRGDPSQRIADRAESHTSNRVARSGNFNVDPRTRSARGSRPGAGPSGDAGRGPVTISQSDFRALQQNAGTSASGTRNPNERPAQSGASGMTPRSIARRSASRTQGARQTVSATKTGTNGAGKSSGFPWPSANPFGGGWPGGSGASATNGSDTQPSRGASGSADGSPDFDRTLQRLISLAEADVAEVQPGGDAEQQQRYIEKHVDLRLLYLIAGRQERALEAIPGIGPADQEFWQQMFWAMTNYFDDEAIPDDAERAAQTVAQLRSALMRLKEKARLGLRNVTFCHKISSYGNYEEFDRNEFSPGQQVLLYAEVDNFQSERTSEGKYRTILKSTIEIYKAGPQGDLVHREEFPATEDLCRNHRRDYFHSYEFAIPERISLGPHVLKLTVEDQLSRKVATYTVKFQVK